MAMVQVVIIVEHATTIRVVPNRLYAAIHIESVVGKMLSCNTEYQ